ncbi:WhiB family transcriptional regulator [Streptomyces sp. NPDC059255]|uniref:WhiB family transcriptional regulator n=1 Tax=Streptomyces sp. NPDC059255 TaxID=3346793 RepID=UPI003677949A
MTRLPGVRPAAAPGPAPVLVDFSQAACVATPGPFGAVPGVSANQQAALAVCARCPVKPGCLEKAMEEEGALPAAHRGGVRGGRTELQRADLYVKRSKACGGRGLRARSASSEQIVTLLRTGISDQAVKAAVRRLGMTADAARIAALRAEYGIVRASGTEAGRG